jgi:hypothetical protein
MKIYEDQVIGDNVWLWRADHAQLPNGKPDNTANITTQFHKEKEYHLTVAGDYPCKTGLEVHGANTTMYGLFVEHTTANLTNWYGDGGRVFFYQSELPYDVNYASTGFFLGPEVASHTGFGIGVYTYYRDFDVTSSSGIVAPNYKGIQITNSLTKHLDGKGGISHVINGLGGAVPKNDIAIYALFEGTAPICPGTPACPAGPGDDPCSDNTCSFLDRWLKQELVVAAVAVLILVHCVGHAVHGVLRAQVLSKSPRRWLDADALKLPACEPRAEEFDTENPKLPGGEQRGD